MLGVLLGNQKIDIIFNTCAFRVVDDTVVLYSEIQPTNLTERYHQLGKEYIILGKHKSIVYMFT